MAHLPNVSVTALCKAFPPSSTNRRGTSDASPRFSSEQSFDGFLIFGSSDDKPKYPLASIAHDSHGCHYRHLPDQHAVQHYDWIAFVDPAVEKFVHQGGQFFYEPPVHFAFTDTDGVRFLQFRLYPELSRPISTEFGTSSIIFVFRYIEKKPSDFCFSLLYQ